MGFFTTIKNNGKRSLSGAWGRAIGVMILTGLPVMLLNLLETGIRKMNGISSFVDYSMTTGNAFDDMANVALISGLISILIGILIFIVSTPLVQGSARWYYRRSGGENDGVTELFHYFESAGDYFKALWLHFQINLRLFLWGLLLLLPILGGLVLVGMQVSSGVIFPQSVITIGKLLLLLWILLIIVVEALIALRYFLASYLLAAHPELKVRQAIKQSVGLMKGHKGNLFMFGLSFILWYLPLIGCVALFVPAMFSGVFYLYQIIGAATLLLLLQLGLCFYLNPYYNAAAAVYARYLIQLGENGADLTADSTREYDGHKTEIDQYLESQRQMTRETPVDLGQPPNVES